MNPGACRQSSTVLFGSVEIFYYYCFDSRKFLVISSVSHI